jgi:hypothetical protein
LCSHCSLIAHSKCACRAPPTCDLRSKLLMHAQFAERGSPADLFSRLPAPAAPASDGLGASSSRGSLDRERANSPQLTSSSPPVAYKVFAPFKRSHTSYSPDPAQSTSSVSLTGAATPPPSSQQQRRQQPPEKNLLSEGGVIRRKLSTILTRQRDPNLHVKDRPRPLSIASIGSSSPHSQQSNSLRSLQTAAESISSRAARVEASIATESSSDAPAATGSGPRRASVYSGASTVPDGVDEPSTAVDLDVSPISHPSASASVPMLNAKKAPAIVGGAQDTHRTRRARGESKSGNCAIQ